MLKFVATLKFASSVLAAMPYDLHVSCPCLYRNTCRCECHDIERSRCWHTPGAYSGWGCWRTQKVTGQSVSPRHCGGPPGARAIVGQNNSTFNLS